MELMMSEVRERERGNGNWIEVGWLMLMRTKEDNKQQSKHTRNYRFKMRKSKTKPREK